MLKLLAVEVLPEEEEEEEEEEERNTKKTIPCRRKRQGKNSKNPSECEEIMIFC